MAFNDKFKQLREKSGLTQKELAAALGVTPRIVSYYETGKTIPSDPELLHKIVSKFNVTLDYLLLDSQHSVPSKYHKLVSKLKTLTETQKIYWQTFAYVCAYDIMFPDRLEILANHFQPKNFSELKSFNVDFDKSYFYQIEENKPLGYLLLYANNSNNLTIALFACVNENFKFISDMDHLSGIEELYILASKEDKELDNFIDDFLENN